MKGTATNPTDCVYTRACGRAHLPWWVARRKACTFSFGIAGWHCPPSAADRLHGDLGTGLGRVGRPGFKFRLCHYCVIPGQLFYYLGDLVFLCSGFLPFIKIGTETPTPTNGVGFKWDVYERREHEWGTLALAIQCARIWSKALCIYVPFVH